MAIDDKVWVALAEYFKNRPELDTQLMEPGTFFAVRSKVKCHHNKNEEKYLGKKSIEVTPERMDGPEDTSIGLIKRHNQNSRYFASRLYGIPQDEVDIIKSSVMINGNTSPIKVNCSLRNSSDSIDETFYIKRLGCVNDLTRIFGIELYRLASGFEEYLFKFGQDIVLENAVRGYHIDSIDDDYAFDPAFRKTIIRNQVLSFWFGIGDIFNVHDGLIRYDNFVVSDKNVKVIDFDRIGVQYCHKVREQIKKDFITAQELDKERIKTASQQKLIILFSVSFLITLLLSIFIYKGYKKTIRANVIIEQQKQDVEKQRDIIHEKNKEITDSINYAKRIQEAILPSRYSLVEHLSNGFVFFKPKDVVSGDFYWLESLSAVDSRQSSVLSNQTTNHKLLKTVPKAFGDGIIFFAAADCTGHGVPGAMVSVVCSNALSKALLEEGETDPGKLLDRTRELVIERFSKSEEDVKDGMDIALCSLRFDVKGLKLTEPQTSNLKPQTIALLQYAGANNPLWIIRPTSNNIKPQTSNLELIEFKPNKQPIGKVENPLPFTTHTIELQKGDSIYIFTDGFADQFGGEKGKKFKYKSLKELLLSIQEQTIEEQKETLDTFFKKWKGDLEQVDDVCIIGVRV